MIKKGSITSQQSIDKPSAASPLDNCDSQSVFDFVPSALQHISIRSGQEHFERKLSSIARFVEPVQEKEDDEESGITQEEE